VQEDVHMMTTTNRCDNIIALVDNCLADYDSTRQS
jgi:hypothetical protein